MHYQQAVTQVANQLTDMVRNANAPDIDSKIKEFKQGEFGHHMKISRIERNGNFYAIGRQLWDPGAGGKR